MLLVGCLIVYPSTNCQNYQIFGTVHQKNKGFSIYIKKTIQKKLWLSQSTNFKINSVLSGFE